MKKQGVEIKIGKIELISINKLKLNKANRNKHPKDQIAELARHYEVHGMRTPIIVSNQSKQIVAGNGRFQAAKKAGLKEIPVSYQDFDTPESEYSFSISDNALGLWSELDLKNINIDIENLFPKINLMNLGIKDFGFTEEDKYAGKDADEVPAPPKKPKSKLGQIYKLGNHRLMCGSSESESDVKALMNGKKAKAWISDPPYGINHVEISNEKGQSKGYAKIANDELKDDDLYKFILKVIETSKPHLEKGFAFYMWHAMKMQAYFSQAAAAAGILFHRQIIWNKPNFVFGRGHYHWKHELCLMGWLEGNEPPFYGQRNQTSVWDAGRENDKIHPTQKPVLLYEIPIKNHLKENEIFMEPFGGSGSGIIAAEKTSRICYCMELEPAYVDVIISRWEKFTGKKASLIDTKLRKKFKNNPREATQTT